MNTKRLLEGYDRYATKLYNATTKAERRYWERHLEQMVIGLAEHGRDVRGEVVDR